MREVSDAYKTIDAKCRACSRSSCLTVMLAGALREYNRTEETVIDVMGDGGAIAILEYADNELGPDENPDQTETRLYQFIGSVLEGAHEDVARLEAERTELYKACDGYDLSQPYICQSTLDK
ncbi:MAG TPA: hypothetical protein PKD20_04235 [Candidatus Saccharibacteria bacterium]|jgi:hypothetical protein|nr:hypothetical protein [Candidatus Saccharibacteria bacterium]HMT56057.1 hypothetical protein [Candidatus Saccharibacteria bacterium]